MLQIISGKFFENDSIEESNCKGIFYSNFYWILPIETCIGTLEPVDIFNMSSISPYVFNYKNQIEKGPNDTIIRTGDVEIQKQFQLLCIFGLKSFFDSDRNYVELLCRKHPKSSAEQILPSVFLPRFFDYHIHGKIEEIEHFIQFVDKVIGLPRRKYLAVLDSINAFSQALQILNYNVDLAYSLMIYSLESLSQKFDEFEPTWEDYDYSVKNKLDELFVENDFEEPTINSVREILLKSSNLRNMARFIDFTSKHVSDNFFKEESQGLKNCIRKSELKESLKNAYKMRSSYAHELEEIEDFLKMPQILKGGESIRSANKPYLTFAGLTRLVNHVIYNFIEEQNYLEEEKYNWRQDLPGIMTMNMHPQHWIGDEKIFKPSDVDITFSGFLTLILDNYFNDKPIINLEKLMLKIEMLIDAGLKDESKYPMISLYFLYNNMIVDDFKSPNYNKFIKNYIALIFKCNIWNMITILLLNKKWPWDVNESVDHYVKYVSKKFNKKSFNIPPFFELCIMIEIANRYLKKENIAEFNKWLDIVILEMPGQSECQKVIEEYKSKKEKIFSKDVLLKCMNGKK